MGGDLTTIPLSPPPEPRPSLLRAVLWLGRTLLDLVLGLSHFLLVVLLDVAFVLARFVLWFRGLFLWLGGLSLVLALINHAMAPSMWRSQIAGAVGGLGLVAFSRAALLLNGRLRMWQIQLHAWAQGWPAWRYM